MRLESFNETLPAILKYYATKSCVICKAKMPTNPEGLFTLLDSNTKEYTSFSSCSKINHNYELITSYVLGKSVEVDSEEMNIYDNNHKYKILNDYVSGSTYITIFNLDENGHTIDDDNYKNIVLKDRQPFIFKKYGKKKFINLIKMFAVFG